MRSTQDGLVDLAEARWRTGDHRRAPAKPPMAALDDEDGPLLALVVAAEAACGTWPPDGRSPLRRGSSAWRSPTARSTCCSRGRHAAGRGVAARWGGGAAVADDHVRPAASGRPRWSTGIRMPHDEEAAAEASAPDDVGEAPAGPGDDADAATIGLWEAGGRHP